MRREAENGQRRAHPGQALGQWTQECGPCQASRVTGCSCPTPSTAAEVPLLRKHPDSLITESLACPASLPSSCSQKYDDYANYNYCDGREASETTAMLQDDDVSSDADEDVIVETGQKLPKESSGVMALQILVPFLLAGFGQKHSGGNQQ